MTRFAPIALACAVMLCFAKAPLAQDAPLSLATLTQMAQDGGAEAQFQLAQRYHNGRGALQSYATAAQWYARAAAAGHAASQNQLGKYHHAGLGVAQDQTLAVKFLNAAAQTGNPDYIFDLAQALENGADGSSNPAAAAELYAAAAAASHGAAAVNLGVLSHIG